MSTFKVYCPKHLLEERANGLSMTFHTPTLMNKIFLETEKQAGIDLNGNLMDQLVAVGLVSELPLGPRNCAACGDAGCELGVVEDGGRKRILTCEKKEKGHCLR